MRCRKNHQKCIVSQNKTNMAQIITSQIVKPSTPTPSSTRNYKLSSIDQVAPSIYIPLIFFYESDQSKLHEQISRCLKKSLSEALAIFYPLAGEIEENSFVDCNDAGVEMVEARVGAPLSHFTQNPKMEELKQLLPADTSSPHGNHAILSLKTSYFDCGGIAVGVCFSHKVGDGGSAAAFVNAWAAACRGEVSKITCPAFDLALRFPPRETLSSAGFGLDPVEDEIATERFVFDGKKMEKLKRAASNGEVKNPSRVEVVSAFIWRSFIEAANKRNKTAPPPASFTAAHAVNLRPRAVPSFPDQTFGNCVAAAFAKISSEEDDGGMSVLVSKLRAAIRGVDGEYVNKIVKDEISGDEAGGEMSAAGNCVFSSWWRFPVYDVDFGLGKPVWVATATMPLSNTVVFMATPCREGIEAWVNLSRDNDDSFETLRANYTNLLN